MSKSKLAASLLGIVVVIGAIVGLGFYFKGQKPASPSQEVAAPSPAGGPAPMATSVPAGTYFASASSGKTVSLFALDGTEVKKMPYPSRGVTKAAGDALYLGSGANSPMNVIATLSLKTNAFSDLDFTKTADKILGWDVAPDHSRIAWLGTDGQLHISNADGSQPEAHQLPNTSPTAPALGWGAVQFSADSKSVLASTVGSRNIWRLDKKSFDSLPESENQIFSPSLKFGAPLYDTEGAIDVTNNADGSTSTAYVEPPDSYVALSPDSSCSFAPSTSVIAFSPDESQLLLKVGAPCAGEKSETFISYIDGGITRLLLKGYSPLAYLDQNTILVKKDSGSLAIASTDDGKILKELPDQTEYLGMIKTEGF